MELLTPKYLERMAFLLEDPNPPYQEKIYTPEYIADVIECYSFTLEDGEISVCIGKESVCKVTGGTWKFMPNIISIS